MCSWGLPSPVAPVVSKVTAASDVPDVPDTAASVESVAEAVAAEERPLAARADGDEADAGEALARITFARLDVRFSAEVGADKSAGAGEVPVPEEAAAAAGEAAAAAAVEDRPGEEAGVWVARR